MVPTSLAEDLTTFIVDVDALASLPDGPRLTVPIIFTLGSKHIEFDDPLHFGLNADAGTKHLADTKFFYQMLDHKMMQLARRDGFPKDLEIIQKHERNPSRQRG